jgi:hypothetical protein
MRLLLALILIAGCAKKTQKPEDNPPAPAAPTPVPADPPPATPQAPTLSANAPEDKPIAGHRTPEQEAKIKELEAQDMKKWPDVKARHAKGLPPGEHLYVTTMLTSPGRTESVFIAVSSIEGSKITGVISSDITNVGGYKVNDRYTLQESAVTDWLISKPDGSEEGNLVGNYLDTLH